MKRGLVLVILIILVGVSFVNASLLGDAWNKITGKVSEENIVTEPVVESEPGSMQEPEKVIEPEVICTADVKECSDSSFVSRNPDNNCEFYPCPSLLDECADKERRCGGSCPPCPKRECQEGETKNYICEDGTEILLCFCEKTAWACKVDPERECSERLKSNSMPKPEPSLYEVKTCAVKIKIDFDKDVYYYGDIAKIRVEISDANGDLLADYPFNSEIYTYSDGFWHTGEFAKTDKNGLFVNNEGRIEKGKQLPGKIKIKVSTAPNINKCNPVEHSVEIEIRGGEEKEEVCGIGVCVPKEEVKEVKEIPKEEIFYSCQGCKLEDKCYPISYRKGGQYCSENYEFVGQLGEGYCDNNFECESNVCVSGECVGVGLMKKIINWFKKMFGGEEKEEEEKLKECSKWLIEKDIGDYEYIESAFGIKEAQVQFYSEEGEQIGTVKCCMARYKNKEENKGMALVCPFNNRGDLINSFKWLSKRGEIVSEEYKNQKVYSGAGRELIIWTHKEFAFAVGIDSEENLPVPEEMIDTYLEKYTNDLDIIEIPSDIPYEPKSWVSCTPNDEKAVKECVSHPGSKLQTDSHPEKDCEVYVGCILSDESKEHQDSVKEFLVKAEVIGGPVLIDFETLPDGTIPEREQRVSGREWGESFGVIFETPSEDYLQLVGPVYPFNPIDKLSLSPGLGPFVSGSDTHDDLNIIFSEPVKAVGIYLLDLGGTDERESITFLDKEGNVIEKISPWPKSTFGNPAPGVFVSLIHDGISKIEILENTQDSDDIAYDNLYFVR